MLDRAIEFATEAHEGQVRKYTSIGRDQIEAIRI